MDRSYDENPRRSYMFTFSSKDCPTLIPTMFLLLHTGATAHQLLCSLRSGKQQSDGNRDEGKIRAKKVHAI